ncbi:MAG: YcaO-like family protein [Pseudonocardia sp.]
MQHTTSDGAEPPPGVVTALCRRPLPARSPRGLRLWQARIADTTAFGPWPADPVASGCAWWDDAAARGAAVGEAVERYCAALPPAGLRRVTARELAAADGPRPLDLARCALFAADRHAEPGFPFAPLREDLPLRWVRGRDLRTGHPRAVPVGLVYTTVHRAVDRRTYADEPVTGPLPCAGVAAATATADAVDNALLELVERDAVARTWDTGRPWTELHVPRTFRDACRAAGRAGSFDIRLFAVPAVVEVLVLAAVAADPVTGFVAAGSAARHDAVHAALKAVAEACQLHLVLAELDDPDSATMRQAAADPRSPLRPWRADRRYLDSYRRPGWRDVHDLACHLQLHLDPRMRERFADRLPRRPRARLTDLGAAPAAAGDALVRAGFEPTVVDVTTSDVRALGGTAVRVVVPGLRPNTPAAYPVSVGEAPSPGRVPLPYA